MTDDPLRRAILSLLGPRPTPAGRRSLAVQLRSLADEQDRLAAAAERDQTRPGERRVKARKPRAGPGRAPSRFVRIEREASGRLRLYIGRGLYYELDSPKRLDVQRIEGRIVLSVVDGGAGYAVMTGKAMPRFYADGARDLLDGMEDGRYAAEVQAGAIVAGERID